MQIKTKIILSTTLAAILCAFRTASAADTNMATTAEIGNPVIARGTGLEITRGDLDEAMNGIKATAAAHNQTISPAQAVIFEKRILDQLIETKLLLAKATDADKAVGASAAKQQMTALQENLGPAELNKQLQAVGETQEQERSRIADQMTARTTLLRELKINVSDDDIQKFFDDNRISSFETPEMARVSHILIFTVDPVTLAPLTADQQAAQRNVAADAIKNIRAGVDFEALAKQFSEDPGSKASGGELAPFPRGQMAPEIDAVAFSLTNNQVSGLITTSVGYQIIKVIERIPAQKTSYLVAAPKIREFLMQQQAQKLEPTYLQGLRVAAGVEILDPNLKAAAPTGSGAQAPPPAVAPKS
jgi:foldase protein PrsA